MVSLQTWPLFTQYCQCLSYVLGHVLEPLAQTVPMHLRDFGALTDLAQGLLLIQYFEVISSGALETMQCQDEKGLCAFTL